MQRAHQGAVLALIEERPRLLAVREIDLHGDAVLAHDRPVGQRAAQEPFDLAPVGPGRVEAQTDGAHPARAERGQRRAQAMQDAWREFLQS